MGQREGLVCPTQGSRMLWRDDTIIIFIFGIEFVCNNGDDNKCSTHLWTFPNSFKDLWALNLSNPKSGHRGTIQAHSVAQFQWNNPSVPAGPEPSLSLEPSRGRTLKLLFASLSSAHNHPVGVGNSSSCLTSAFLLSGAPNTWTGEGIYPRLLSKAGIIAVA